MELNEIPELEDCAGKLNIKSYARISDGLNNNTLDKRDFDSQLGEETRKIFKKALKKSYSEHKKFTQVESSLAADATRSSTSNDNRYPEWISEDLLARISSDPEIISWLQDPEKVSLLNKSQADPTELIKSKNANENLNIIRKFSAILGEHFEKLSIEQEQEAKQEIQPRKPLIEELGSSGEKELQAKVEELLANDKVRCALQDDEVRKIVQALRSNPEIGQQLVVKASSDVKRKIHLLVQKGVLAVQ